MCYQATDTVLKKLEAEYKAVWLEANESAHCQPQDADKALERHYDRFNLNYPQACCHDYAVYLGDSIDMLKLYASGPDLGQALNEPT